MLADLLFGAQRQRVLSLLFLQPQLSLHVRELARQTGSQPGTLNREVGKLAEAGLLVRQRVGNQVHYQANRDCPVFDELASLLRKTSGIAALIADALAPLSSAISCALIYGSIARGTETSASDVDVLVLGEVGFAEIVEALHPLQATLRREINPVVYRPADFREKLAGGNTWAYEVVATPKQYVMGTADDFAELVGDSAPDGVPGEAG